MTSLFSQNTLWERLFEAFIGRALNSGVEPLTSLIYMLGSVMFGVVVIAGLILVGRYFVRWIYDEFLLRRGRDSLAGLQDRASSNSSPREGRRSSRRRRKLVPGVRRRT